MGENLIAVRRALYQLKRAYGREGSLYRETPGTINLETGNKSITKVKYTIDKMVVVPFKFSSLGFYSSAMLKTARQFSYGGFQDQDLKRVIIDGEDLPDGFKIQPDDYVIYDHRKFEVVSIEEIEEGCGYNLVVNYLRGAIANEVHEVSVYQSLRLTQTTGVT